MFDTALIVTLTYYAHCLHTHADNVASVLATVVCTDE